MERLLAAAMDDGSIADAVIANSIGQAEGIWRIRHAVADCNRAAGIVLSHDTAVPIEKTPDFLAEVDRRLRGVAEHAYPVYVGHIGDGNVHVAVIHPREHYTLAAFEARAPFVNDIVYDVTHSLGGSISAEHGIGQSLKRTLTKYKDPTQMRLMQRIKLALDPHGIMNPGKVLELHLPPNREKH